MSDTLKQGIYPVGKINLKLEICLSGEVFKEKQLDLTRNGLKKIPTNYKMVQWDQAAVADALHTAIINAINNNQQDEYIVAHSAMITIPLPDEFTIEGGDPNAKEM